MAPTQWQQQQSGGSTKRQLRLLGATGSMAAAGSVTWHRLSTLGSSIEPAATIMTVEPAGSAIVGPNLQWITIV
mgnify:CR=1 FL=1